MNTRNLFAVSLLAAVTGTAFAQGDLSRAQVNQEVLAARAAGQLVPAGERGLLVVNNQPSTRSLADVRSEVLAARRDGDLVPAGQGPVDVRPTLASDTTRFAVKSDVRRARADGELIPAGEGVETPLFAQSRATHRSGAVAYSAADRTPSQRN